MATIKTNLANRGNYGSSRSTGDIKYIVIHYTGNDGDTDENNGNYFKNNVVEVSAHYFVDDDSVTQSVPDNYVAWHCGGKKYPSCSTTGGGKYYGKCTNANSIGIEICDDVKNGTIYPSAKTIANVLELTKSLMKKYKVPAANVIRHFDVTGKTCPAYWCGNATNNSKWKSEFWNKLGNTETSTTTSSTTATKKLYRVQVGAFSVKSNADRLVKELTGKGYKAFSVKSGSLYRVQIGAFSVKANADKLAAEIKSKGYSPFVKLS